MQHYDPDQTPDPRQWLALDEPLRTEAVAAYHRQARIKLPDIRAHAIFHTIVENQIAEGFEPVGRAMARLTGAGLSRHDALHAIGSVLAQHVHELFNDGLDPAHTAAVYGAAVERLTARSWLEG